MDAVTELETLLDMELGFALEELLEAGLITESEKSHTERVSALS